MADNGPVPMESTSETEAFYHNDAAQINNVNAVVRADIDILGRVFDCFVDTGAPDTVLSNSLVCRLELMDKMVPSHTSFLTAAGKTEKSMSLLPNLPITIGCLTLHIDCMVTKANNYNALIGNDWLRMAGADILLSSSLLRTRPGPDQYEDILIDTDGGALRVHMCQPAGREAVQCLVQCPMLNDTGEMSDSSSTQNSDSDAESEVELDSDAESEVELDSDAESDAEPDSDGEWDGTEIDLAEIYEQLRPRPERIHDHYMSLFNSPEEVSLRQNAIGS